MVLGKNKNTKKKLKNCLNGAQIIIPLIKACSKVMAPSILRIKSKHCLYFKNKLKALIGFSQKFIFFLCLRYQWRNVLICAWIFALTTKKSLDWVSARPLGVWLYLADPRHTIQHLKTLHTKIIMSTTLFLNL